MVTEAQIITALTTTLVTLGIVDSAEDVYTNDWAGFDTYKTKFVLFSPADSYQVSQRTVTPTSQIMIKLQLVRRCSAQNWQTDLNAFITLRDALMAGVINQYRSVGNSTDISLIRTLSPVGYIFPPGVDPQAAPTALPDYVAQLIGLQVDQF